MFILVTRALLCAFVLKLISVVILSEVNTVQAMKSFCTITANLGDIRLINRFAVPRACDLNLTLRVYIEKRYRRANRKFE